MKSRSALFLLAASLLIVMLGFGIVLPLMAFFVTHFGATGGAMGIMMASYSIMQFIFAPLWGRLSDRVGRKPVFLIGITGFALAFVFQGIAPNLVFFIVARSIAGILSAATLPTAMAYIADITPPQERSRNMGMLGAAMGMGMIFGPTLGGILSSVQLALPPALAALIQTTTNPENGQNINLTLPFLTSSLLAFIAVPFAYFLMPESLTPARRREASQAQSANASNTPRLALLSQALKGPMGFLFAMAFLLAFSLANMEGVFGLYGQVTFNMGPAEIGLILGAMGILSVIVQGGLIGPLTRRFGEEKVLLGGLLVSMTGLLGLALLPTRWGMIASALVFNAGNVLLQPSVTSLISQRTDPRTQGAAMGISNSFQSLGRATGPLWAGFAFDIYHTLSFWTAAIIQLAAFVYGLNSLGRAAPDSRPFPAEQE